MPKPFFLPGKVLFFFFFPSPSGSSGFNCSSTATSNQSQFLKSHHDKQPQFITHQCRNLELNLHFQTLPAWRNNYCRSFVWPRVYIRVSVCAHACVVPHQHPHPSTAAWPPGRPPFPRYLPAILHPFTFTAHSSVPPTARWLEVMTSVVLGVVCLPAFFLRVTSRCTNSFLHIHKMIRGEQTSMVFMPFSHQLWPTLLCLMNKSICVANRDISSSM